MFLLFSFCFHFRSPISSTFIFQIVFDFVLRLLFYLVFVLLHSLLFLSLFIPCNLLTQKCRIKTDSLILFPLDICENKFQFSFRLFFFKGTCFKLYFIAVLICYLYFIIHHRVRNVFGSLQRVIFLAKFVTGGLDLDLYL